MEKVEKLPMCRICLVENVRMCVVTNKSLQEIYEKLTDVPFVTEDRKPMLACLFCCTRLKQCCQLQRKCVEAEELLAQMLTEDYEQKPLTNRGHLEFVGGFIVTPIETISIVDDCQIASDVIKQELPAVCEEQDVELEPENLYNNHPDVEVHHSEFESEKDQLLVEIKIEKEELSENLKVRETEKLELENVVKSYPGDEHIPANDSKSDSEDDLPLVEIKTEAKEDQTASKKKQTASVTQRAGIAKTLILQRLLEEGIPAKQTTNVPSDSKIIRTTKPNLKPENLYNSHPDVEAHHSESESEEEQLLVEIKIEKKELSENLRVTETERAGAAKTLILQRLLEERIPAKQTTNVPSDTAIIRTTKPSTSESVAKIKEPITTISQSNFSQSSNSIQHTRIHTGENPFKCDVCQCSFTESSLLKQHNRIHKVKPYKCDVCQRSFGQKSNFDKHFRKHFREKSFKCDVCQRSFSRKSDLNVHFRNHTGEKPFKCDVCQRSFTQSRLLKQHILIHTGEKPYKCDICQRSFSQKCNFNVHYKNHSSEKPFKCHLCRRSYAQSCLLKQHIRIHTGERPYECDVCQRSFVYKCSLNKHFRQNHSAEKNLPM